MPLDYDAFLKDCVISVVALDNDEIKKTILHRPSRSKFTAQHKSGYLLHKLVDSWITKTIKELKEKTCH